MQRQKRHRSTIAFAFVIIFVFAILLGTPATCSSGSYHVQGRNWIFDRMQYGWPFLAYECYRYDSQDEISPVRPAPAKIRDGLKHISDNYLYDHEIGYGPVRRLNYSCRTWWVDANSAPKWLAINQWRNRFLPWDFQRVYWLGLSLNLICAAFLFFAAVLLFDKWRSKRKHVFSWTIRDLALGILCFAIFAAMYSRALRRQSSMSPDELQRTVLMNTAPHSITRIIGHRPLKTFLVPVPDPIE